MNFKLPYDEAKKIMSIFFQSPYQVSAPYVAVLDNLQNDEGKTLRECIEAEIKANKDVAPEPEPTE